MVQTIVCDLKECGFYKEGFCCKELVNMQQGVCKQIYKNGQVLRTALEPVEESRKLNLMIEEGEYEEYVWEEELGEEDRDPGEGSESSEDIRENL